jgi:hypothetical protein
MCRLPRRSLLGLVVSVAVLAALVATSCTGMGCASRQESIWVTGLDDSSVERFSYAIENTGVLMTGATNEFKVSLDKGAFFQELRRAFPVFSESDDGIQVVADGEIYTIRQYGNDDYVLYGEYFMFRHGDSVALFPFPTDKILYNYDPVPYVDIGFRISCDLQYLQRFYEVYGADVIVEGNTIQYRRLSIVVQDGGRVEVVGL